MSRISKHKKKMLTYLETMLGGYSSDVLLSILCDLINEMASEVGPEGRVIRTMELTINEFFSTKFDLQKGRICQEGK